MHASWHHGFMVTSAAEQPPCLAPSDAVLDLQKQSADAVSDHGGLKAGAGRALRILLHLRQARASRLFYELLVLKVALYALRLRFLGYKLHQTRTKSSNSANLHHHGKDFVPSEVASSIFETTAEVELHQLTLLGSMGRTTPGFLGPLPSLFIPAMIAITILKRECRPETRSVCDNSAVQGQWV